MKYILTEEHVPIPNGITVQAKQKQVEVKGPRGVLKRNFKYSPIDIFAQTKENKKTKAKKTRVSVQQWQTYRKQRCQVNSVASQIKNMIRGVTTGYKFKMVFAFAHFPIIVNLLGKGDGIEIKNFLGEKIVRTIQCLPGVTITRNEDEKNTITLLGNDLNNVSLTCALIHQSVAVKNKDIRQFLDGIYVSEKRLEI
ncbi:60S ribosomal protein L9 [Paramecium bursaria]